MISTGKPICLSVEGNCVEGRHFIILDNGEVEIGVELSDLCQLSGVYAASVQRAVCNQRNIDLWMKMMTENIQFIAIHFQCKYIEVSVQDTFVYRNHMFSSAHPQIDEPYTYYVHPYMLKRCAEKEIKRIISNQTNSTFEKVILKIGLWNGAHFFTFNQQNINYIQPEYEDY